MSKGRQAGLYNNPSADGQGLVAPSGDGRNQENFIALAERITRASEEPDVLVVHVDVDEALRRPVGVRERLLDSRELVLQRFEKLFQVLGADLGCIRSARESPQRRRDSDFHDGDKTSQTSNFAATA